MLLDDVDDVAGFESWPIGHLPLCPEVLFVATGATGTEDTGLLSLVPIMVEEDLAQRQGEGNSDSNKESRNKRKTQTLKRLVLLLEC